MINSKVNIPIKLASNRGKIVDKDINSINLGFIKVNALGLTKVSRAVTYEEISKDALYSDLILRVVRNVLEGRTYCEYRTMDNRVVHRFLASTRDLKAGK